LTTIVCATKAAQNSREVHQRAFEIAAETGHELEFLHVVGVPNFDDLMEPMQEAVLSELHWLVHSLTRISRQRSGHHDIQPTVEVVSGPIPDAILRHIENEDVQTLVIGGTADEETSVFERVGFDSFLLEAHQANVRVELVG
jgi:nucleotide-binding universal stress UspA family protein